MDYLGPIDLTLIYSTPGRETPIAHPGVTATLLFNAPHRIWTVLVDHPDNLVGNGLSRAEVVLSDGRKLAGAARRPSILGNAFELVEDGPLELDLKAVLEQRFAMGQGVVTLAATMSDEQILALIKGACNWSKGKAFQVIPPQAE